jgi:hypothetical protein
MLAYICSQIEELKASVTDEEDAVDDHESPVDDALEQEPPLTAGMLLGNTSNITRAYLISSIPPRDVSERALWHWFNSSNPELRK